MATSFHFPDTDLHLLESAHVSGQTYQIEVMQPLLERGSDRRFPVLYVTDGNESFGVARGLAVGLQASGHAQPFIVVGIGYPGASPYAGDILRGRDLTPPYRKPIPGRNRVSPVEGVASVPDGQPDWNGGDAFLKFVETELVPFIDANYPTSPGERVYFGHSLGGGLGLHALLSTRGLFDRYIISSPGLSFEGDAHGIRPFENLGRFDGGITARLFLSVGALEEFEPRYARTEFCSSFYKLVALLDREKPQGIELYWKVFPAEVHATSWVLALDHGIRTLLPCRPATSSNGPTASIVQC